MTLRDMLAEYFSLTINAAGLVESLPLLLRDYTPNLDKLPSFLMRLGPQVSKVIFSLFCSHDVLMFQVNWMSETECFESFFRELAYFYIPGCLPSMTASNPLTDEEKAQEKAEQWQIQHILFPSMRRYLAAPKSLLDRDVVQVASLPELYRVFERC